MGFERPGSYPGHAAVQSEEDAFKTGCVTGALVQCPKLCPYISRILTVIESQPLSGRDSFSGALRPDNTLLIDVTMEKDKKRGKRQTTRNDFSRYQQTAARS